LAVIGVVLLAFSAIFALGWVMARHVTQLAADLPRYQATISAKIEKFQGGGNQANVVTLERAGQVLKDLSTQLNSKQTPAQPSQAAEDAGVPRQAGPATGTEPSPIPVVVHEPIGNPLHTISKLISPLLGPMATTGLIVVFVIFMLVQREDLRNRLIRLAGSTDIPHTTAAIDDAAHRLSHLFLTQLAINSAFAILVGLGLSYIGIPSAFLWGTLAGILRFIPFIGPILGLIFPLVLAVSIDPGWSMVIWTAVLFIFLEALTGQVIEPIVLGRSSGVSPLAVVLAATFWAWLWGPIGLVLATPLTVMLVVLGRHVESLGFLNVMFGDEQTLSDTETFYQRMLARDPVEAVEQAKSFMATHSLSGYCDEIARPALILAQKDADRGVLDQANMKVMHETLESVFADIAHERWFHKREAHAATFAAAASLPTLQKDQLALNWRSDAPLVSIGVHTELDQAAAAVLATLVEIHGIDVRTERPDALAARNLAKLDLSGAALICLSCVDMKTPAHIHYAARRLKTRAPHAKLLLGIWSAADDRVLTDLKAAVNADYVTSNFHQAAVIILEEATTQQVGRTENLERRNSARSLP